MDTNDKVFIEAVRKANTPPSVRTNKKSIAALIIQSHIRGYLTRQDGYTIRRKDDFSAVADLSKTLHTESTSTITRPVTQAPPPSCASSTFGPKSRPAFSKTDQQVFRYYRDLINFKDRGDPAKLLRCINPSESHLLDAASGVHVRFRLAGFHFPPSVYYKLFTRRPVQDLCANSPKDYTQNATRQPSKDINNKPTREIPKIDKSKWYQREENNGWRLVSDKLPQAGKYRLDPTYVYKGEAPSMNKPFLHTKLLRKEDVDKRRKKRKIDWLKKMYMAGSLQAKSEDEDTVELIKGATIGMLNTIATQGDEAVQNWEVDELLNWTSTLNYDDYFVDWHQLATSNNSIIDKDINTEEVYPLELNSIKQNNRILSSHASHNTPVSNVPST